MSPRFKKVAVDPGVAAARVFAANEQMNQIILASLDAAAWKVKPPGSVRSIAAIFTHMHNVRTKWIRLTAPHVQTPAQLNRAHCSVEQARTSLAESGARCVEILSLALGGDDRVTTFHRDGWARGWPVGVEMLCYMVAHEAHHRGQVCLLAHQLGFPLKHAVTSRLWDWEKLWAPSTPPALSRESR